MVKGEFCMKVTMIDAGKWTYRTLLAAFSTALLWASFPAQAGQYGNFTYTADGTNSASNSVTITGFASSANNAVIPSKINNLSVASIAKGAFFGITALTNVSISSGVTNIGDAAFAGCSGLTSLNIPTNVLAIGGLAFKDCSNLTQITLNSKLLSIGPDAFEGCSSLARLTIPDSVTNIGALACEGCAGLTSASIPRRATKIPDGFFKDCQGLASFSISGTVSTIGAGAFTGCSALAGVSVPSSVSSIENSAFMNCVALTAMTNLGAITSIEASTFYGCSGLQNIVISNGVAKIGWQAFYGCSSLTSLSLPASATNIAGRAFEGCSSLTRFTIPSGTPSIAQETFRDCAALTNITIPGSVTNIGDRAFEGCANLVGLIIPASVKSIGADAFSGCASLGEICFLGTPPQMVSNAIPASATVYWLAGTKGWSNTFGGLQTVAIKVPMIVAAPSSGVVALGSNYTLSASAFGLGSLSWQWQHNDTNIPKATASSYTIKGATWNDAGDYWVIVTNASGSVTSAVAQIIVADQTVPILKISLPAANSSVYSTNATASFTASDNVGVQAVKYRINNGDWLDAAKGTTNWTGAISLNATNRTACKLQAYAVDAAANGSPTNSVSFTYVPVAPLGVSTTGAGTVAPWTNGMWLVIGDKYTNTAKPAVGYVLSNWTGSVASRSNPLVFLMASNFSLQANFVTNPFTGPSGNYNGLFWPVDDQGAVSESLSGTNAGLLNMTLTTNGAFTGKIWSLGTNAAFSGQFDAGFDTLQIQAKPNLTVTLELDPAARLLTGSIAQGTNWASPLRATRAAKTGIQAGKYTALIEGSLDGVQAGPPGDCRLALDLATNGTVSAKGALADGTAISPAAGIDNNGAWPLYASLYGGKGVVLGWITNASGGSVAWAKPAGLSKQTYYTNGFAILSRETVVAPYTAPATNANALTWTNGWIIFEGGNLPYALSNQVVISKDTLKTNWGSVSNLTLSITNANGLFGGSFKKAGDKSATAFFGAVLQNRPDGTNNEAGGWFAGTNECGIVRLRRAD